ncbi:MAG: FecR family protein, partial [Pseudomonadota bacterium]
MNTAVKLNHTLLVIALAAIYPLQATAAASAGVAQFIAGDVNVRRPDGGTAPLAKGKDIESGESIMTGVNGRAQLKFTDGGLISLQPNTEFKITNYSDNAANPKEERFLVDLLRGSMRAITGLIGKRNRENYKVTTTTATIGIRGSGFTAGYNPDGSLGVTTELDAIEVCNAGGCVGLTAGESVRVANSTDAPV